MLVAMSGCETAPAIPKALRELVVSQAYDAYTEEDQAVWRFVVQHTHRRLQHRAHAAYAPGFEAAGISTDRIPSIEAMSRALEAFGWSAVCVDGFIPPRAFQAFQANRILPIAADIRTRHHLTYTPAPDIIHEAAGHTPFLSEPSYARYLMRIGDIGGRAFSSAGDDALYQAIYTLSEVKENPGSTADQVARAERAVEAAVAQQGAVTEATQLARLYWWTVEYGLIGTTDRYGLYGAGLLSSIGEGYFCDDPAVAKLPLTAQCVERAYDITRPQPQLFVARDFEQLDSVLDTVAHGFAQQRGGRYGLGVAQASGEIATLTLDAAPHATGSVRALCALDDRESDVHSSALFVALDDGHTEIDGEAVPIDGVLVGYREGGGPLSTMSEARLSRALTGDRLELSLQHGAMLEAQLLEQRSTQGRIALLRVCDARLVQGDRVVRYAQAPERWLLAGAVVSVAAGGLQGPTRSSLVPSRPPSMRVPRPRTRNAADTEVLALFERAHELFRSAGGAELARAAEGIVARLDVAYPDEWLLRFELLQGLVHAGQGAALRGKLEADLERLELRFAHREPIATGLSYLRSLSAEARR
jgi:phenylalanine-4-hydroxylase